MKKNDFILIAIVLLIAIGSFFAIFMLKNEGEQVVISVDGKEEIRLSLKENISYTVKSERGENVIEIVEGEASCVFASCPDRLCVKQAKISKESQSIVCLPNKMVVEVKGGDKAEIDSIAN